MTLARPLNNQVPNAISYVFPLEVNQFIIMGLNKLLGEIILSKVILSRLKMGPSREGKNWLLS